MPHGLEELLRRLGAGSSPENPDRGARRPRGGTGGPNRTNTPPLPPQSFRDTLSALLGRDVNIRTLPSLAGRSGLATPVMPNTIFTEPEFAGDDPASRFTQGHELGHLLDFSDEIPEEAQIKSSLEPGEDEVEHAWFRQLQRMLGLVKEDPGISEEFADQFENALSSFSRGDEPETRTEEQLHDFIRRRLAAFEREQEQKRRRARQQAMRGSRRDATAIGGR